MYDYFTTSPTKLRCQKNIWSYIFNAWMDGKKKKLKQGTKTWFVTSLKKRKWSGIYCINAYYLHRTFILQFLVFQVIGCSRFHYNSSTHTWGRSPCASSSFTLPVIIRSTKQLWASFIFACLKAHKPRWAIVLLYRICRQVIIIKTHKENKFRTNQTIM